jgi:hypothetical protein
LETEVRRSRKTEEGSVQVMRDWGEDRVLCLNTGGFARHVCALPPFFVFYVGVSDPPWVPNKIQ